VGGAIRDDVVRNALARLLAARRACIALGACPAAGVLQAGTLRLSPPRMAVSETSIETYLVVRTVGEVIRVLRQLVRGLLVGPADPPMPPMQLTKRS
jgi:hypothetical protein